MPDYQKIYEEYKASKVPMRILADKYGVSKQAISHGFKKLGLETRIYTRTHNTNSVTNI